MNTLCFNCWGSKRDPNSGVPCMYCAASGVMLDTQLSPHFMLSELVHSDQAIRNLIPNNPSADIVAKLTRLANEILEPIRSQFGLVHINSGYRSPEVNAAIGGSKTSAHMQGWAADIGRAGSASRKEITDWMIASDLKYDQTIFEGVWCHVGLYHPDGVTQRRESLMMFPGPDRKPQYFAYDPTDPRIG